MRALKLMVLGSALALGGLTGVGNAAPEVPVTAAEHEAAADDYRAKAKSHRAEAAMHRSMAEMYQAQVKGPTNRKPNPWLINMVKHCKQLAITTDQLAGEEEKAAELLSKQAKVAQPTAQNN